MEDRKTIFLWRDLWHLAGVLVLRYIVFMSFMMLQVISSEVKVNSMLKDKTRNWRPARSKTLVTIHSQLFLVELKNEDKAL